MKLSLLDIEYLPYERPDDWPLSLIKIPFKIRDRYFIAESATLADLGPQYAMMVELGIYPEHATMIFETDADGNGFGVTENNVAGDPPLVKIDKNDPHGAIESLLNLLNK